MLLTAAAVIVGTSVILFDPIFQGLAVSLMAGEIASTLISRMAVPVLYYMLKKQPVAGCPFSLQASFDGAVIAGQSHHILSGPYVKIDRGPLVRHGFCVHPPSHGRRPSGRRPSMPRPEQTGQFGRSFRHILFCIFLIWLAAYLIGRRAACRHARTTDQPPCRSCY